uniref:Uncharacterized protein n=1 Tax=Meloidogyne enterolobii TaxID=390850 RepID=A0A6V7UB14_MELEN|nr:unnamed protein product [Meloidogyne enterolobii]
MTEERPSTNTDLEFKLYKQNNNLIKLETNLQIKFLEEKTLNLEKKNFFLEHELKEMDKKIQKTNADHKNEIEQIKKNLNFIDAKFQLLKAENDICLKQKDEKIKFLENEIKEIHAQNFINGW